MSADAKRRCRRCGGVGYVPLREVDEAAAADDAVRRISHVDQNSATRIDGRVAACPACRSLGTLPDDWVRCKVCDFRAGYTSGRFSCDACRGCGWISPEDDAARRLA